jgi:hypothetical protein
MTTPVTLHEPDGTTYEVALVRAGTRAGLPSATFELDATTWERVEDHGSFHTDPGRSGGRARTFDLDRPLLLEAVLDPIAAVHGADDLAARLVGAEADSPLVSTEAWWVLSVTQEVPLPPDLAGSGSLQEGISYAHPSWLVDAGTSSLGEAWERALELGEHRDFNPDEPLLGLIHGVFEEDDWVVERPDEYATILQVPVDGQHGRFDLWIRTDEAAQLVTAFAVLPHDVPLDRVGAVLELAARMNQSMAVGSYEADPDSGLLSFKSGIDVAGDRLSVALVRRLVADTLMAAEKAWSALDEVLAGITPQEPAS